MYIVLMYNVLHALSYCSHCFSYTNSLLYTWWCSTSLMDQIVQRVELRYVSVMNGVQCVMTFGVTMMLVLYADKLGIIPVVSLYINFKFHNYIVCHLSLGLEVCEWRLVAWVYTYEILNDNVLWMVGDQCRSITSISTTSFYLKFFI